MRSTNSMGSQANGHASSTTSDDIVMGGYYLPADPMAMFTGGDDERLKLRDKIPPENLKGEGMVFANAGEVFLAYSSSKVGTHARVKVRLPIEKHVISEVRVDKDKTKVDEVPRHASGLVSTTVGRVIFNDILEPQM